MNHDLFQISSWSGVALVVLLGLHGISKYGGGIFRPSFVVLGMYHLLFQWPLAIASDSIYDAIPNAIHYLTLINGFVVLGTIGSLLITSKFNFDFRGIFSGVETQKVNDNDFAYVTSILLLGLLSLLGVYFYYVPYDCTGIYALLHSPGLLNAVRELSLKLLIDPFPKYAYSIFRSVILPLLVAVFSLYIFVGVASGKYMRSLAAVAITIILFPFSMIIGVKGDAVYIVLVIMVTFMVLTKSIPMKILCACVTVAVGLSLMTLITLLTANNFSATREAVQHFHDCEKGLGQHGIIDYYLERYTFQVSEGGAKDESTNKRDETTNKRDETTNRTSAIVQFQAMLERVFKTPTMVAGWYFEYVQQEGFVGASGLPRLASLIGVPYIDLPNSVGVRYAEHGQALKTVSAVTGYIVWWYACFGLTSLAAALVALWLLDFALFVFLRYVRGILRVPAYAVLMVISTKFAEGDWTVVLITHGFLILIIVAIGVDRISRFLARKFRFYD